MKLWVIISYDSTNVPCSDYHDWPKMSCTLIVTGSLKRPGCAGTVLKNIQFDNFKLPV